MIPLIYDQVNKWAKDDDFFMELLSNINVKKIADLGCGTGRLTIQFAKKGCDITAIDPNEEAIAVARLKQGAEQIQWIVGDSSDLPTNSFDLVIMTANVAQVFLTNESWQQMLADVYRSLKPGGHFIFDTRNPKVKVWEAWAADQTPDLVVHPETGEPLEIHTSYEGWSGNVFTFYETVQKAQSSEAIVRLQMQLCFREYDDILLSLSNAGFKDIIAYDNWSFQQAHEHSSSFIFHSQK